MRPLKHVKNIKRLTCNGCSFAPDFDFRICCHEHDKIYTFQSEPRRVGDRRLRKCIKNEGHPILAWVYWVFVRIFGWIAWLKWRM